MSALQRAIVQSPSVEGAVLPLTVSGRVAIPEITTPYHVLVQVTAVALNATDFKMSTRFHMEKNVVGCDFCGVVTRAGTVASDSAPEGTRVCGAVFPYRPDNVDNGAFAQWLVADSRHLLRVPETWTDTQAAALGAVGWSTVGLCMSDPEALALVGRPTCPVEKPAPVLVYGGATATGLLAIQILKISGYLPIAVCSDASAQIATMFGAVGTVSYDSNSCAQDVKAIAGGVPIRHALDCITDGQSSSVCFQALGRTGGRYVCLEKFQDAWRTRRAVRVKMVMGYEILGENVDFGDDVYTRRARPAMHTLGTEWRGEMQNLLDTDALLKPLVRDLGEGLEKVITGLQMLQDGHVRGGKIVVRLPKQENKMTGT